MQSASSNDTLATSRGATDREVVQINHTPLNEISGKLACGKTVATVAAGLFREFDSGIQHAYVQ